MTERVPERHGNGIILAGSFNPQIFQPAWLAAQNLIRPAESENADIQIVHSEIVAYRLDWAHIEVDREKLEIVSTPKSETPEQIRDLALGVIEILRHTPIHLVGIKFFGHHALKDQAERDKIGWTLVPPGPFEGQIQGPGMRTLRVVGRHPGEEDKGDSGLMVTIEPSNPLNPYGVFISVVDQFEVAEESEPSIGAGPAIDCIKENWSKSIKRASAITDDVLALR